MVKYLTTYIVSLFLIMGQASASYISPYQDGGIEITANTYPALARVPPNREVEQRYNPWDLDDLVEDLLFPRLKVYGGHIEDEPTDSLLVPIAVTSITSFTVLYAASCIYTAYTICYFLITSYSSSPLFD